jgi:two-component system C4-dicarboxylate transport response regulator DctD
MRSDVDVPAELTAEIAGRGWPGNVRELRNAADRFVLGLDANPDDVPQMAEPRRLSDKVAAYEKGLISSALTAHGGSLKPVYEQLGVSRKTLYEKMQKYGLDKNLNAASLQDDF